MLNLEAHRVALAIDKKTLDENHFKAAHKTMEIEIECILETNSQANGILNGDLDIGLFELSMMDISYILRTRLLGKFNPVM